MNRMPLHILGMTLLGVLALWAFAAIVQTRIGQPLQEDTEPSFGITPVAALAEGLKADIGLAAQSLDSNKTEAVLALDAAKRVSELGMTFGEPFQTAHETVLRTRRSIADGHPDKAKRLLQNTQLTQFDVKGASGNVNSPHTNLRSYKGAVVLDRQGIRIGEVVDVAEHQGRPMLQLAIGGVRNALGFIDWGGKRMWIDPSALVFGKVKTVGSTMIAWSDQSQRLAQNSD
ncbi:argininosuccinate lyase [Novimethylophilus kurashikiensis]|uniref:Argininosuccinate lyase n=1 Tax=Novimethylophilus kurashikiensis TaxID=1825523 RepID=A0A2R5F863_9PROT|nr:hypothetical protein [Novimethylophilus kurashikiensis]GBG14225.1 argininosuccinate lyase [Novimethylophilus kurashikiensis]